MSLRRHIRPFAASENGAAMVEFAIILPTLLLFLGLCVEGGRTFLSYQTTITGVREAARYLSRVVPTEICTTGGTTTGWDATLADMVRNSQTGDSLLPVAVTVSSVVSTLSCSGAGFRGGVPAIATVTAQLQIDYPFSGLIGGADEKASTIRTTVSDSTRVLGR